MSGKRITLKLTPEQQEEIKRAIGKTTEVLDLSVEELEDRIAPGINRIVVTDG